MESWLGKLREEFLGDKERAIRRSGEFAERKVKRILSQLKKEGKIKGFEQTVRFSPADLRGIDFIIYSERGHVFLQVKSRLDKKIAPQGLIEISPGIWRKGRIYTIEGGPKKTEGAIKERILKILKIEENK
jgi:hypothetical protein